MTTFLVFLGLAIICTLLCFVYTIERLGRYIIISNLKEGKTDFKPSILFAFLSGIFWVITIGTYLA